VPADLGAGDNRMSFWELREPLMRLCLEVKQSRGEPLRMIVDFLRAWYGSDLLDELFRLPVEAELATTYASEAFRTLEGEVSLPNLFRGSSSEILARAELGLSLLPERSELLHARAAGLLGEGRFEEARDELDSLANAAPDGFIKTWLSAQLKIAKGALEEPVDLEALVADLQAIREETAHGPSTLDFVASILSLFGLEEEALAVFREGAALQPEDGRFQVGIGLTLRELGRDEEALEALARASELDPADASAHNHRGQALGALGRHEEALEAFTEAAELDPATAEFKVNLGVALGKLGRSDEALEALSQAIEIDAQDASAYGSRGLFLGGLGRHEEAAGDFAKAVELDPGNAIAHSNLGAALGRTGRYEEALATLTRAVGIEPTDATAHANRGTALQGLGRLEEACAAYEEAIALDPDDKFAPMGLGVALVALGHPTEALEAFDAALELDPEDASLQERRGFSLRSLGRMEEALAAFERTAELDPADADQQNNRANVLMALERPREAAEAARRAIALDAGASIFRFTLAEAALLCGDLEQFFPALGDALAIWEGEPKRGRPGQPDLLCQILWRRFRDDPRLPEAIAGIGTAYAGVEAVDELGRGVVSTVPLFVDSEISETQAEAWVGHWAAAPAGSELEIPLDILRAALAWKRDRDRAHLLALPSEQREILAGLLTR
jgi:tetratricopeptide (TPR) repeat protein